MVEQDTIRLLRECDAGVKMGVESIDEVLEYVGSERLKTVLTDCKNDHEKLNGEIQTLLDKYKDEGNDALFCLGGCKFFYVAVAGCCCCLAAVGVGKCAAECVVNSD